MVLAAKGPPRSNSRGANLIVCSVGIWQSARVEVLETTFRWAINRVSILTNFRLMLLLFPKLLFSNMMDYQLHHRQIHTLGANFQVLSSH